MVMMRMLKSLVHHLLLRHLMSARNQTEIGGERMLKIFASAAIQEIRSETEVRIGIETETEVEKGTGAEIGTEAEKETGRGRGTAVEDREVEVEVEVEVEIEEGEEEVGAEIEGLEDGILCYFSGSVNWQFHRLYPSPFTPHLLTLAVDGVYCICTYVD